MQALGLLTFLIVSLWSPNSLAMKRSSSPMPATAAARIAAEANKHPTLSPVYRPRRLSDTVTMKETYPLRGSPGIMVVTYLTSAARSEARTIEEEARTFDTLVIDRNETDLRNRQLFRLTTFSHIDAEVAHQAAEDWCNKMFPSMAFQLLESPPQLRRQVRNEPVQGVPLVDQEVEIVKRYHIIDENGTGSPSTNQLRRLPTGGLAPRDHSDSSTLNRSAGSNESTETHPELERKDSDDFT